LSADTLPNEVRKFQWIKQNDLKHTSEMDHVNAALKNKYSALTKNYQAKKKTSLGVLQNIFFLLPHREEKKWLNNVLGK